MLEESEVRTIGKYEVLGPLGRGTMGMVYKARDPEIGRLVAIKTLRKLVSSGTDNADAALERFRQEARSAGNLRHPNIITIFEAGRDGDTPFIVMDYVEGATLDRMLEREGKLPVDRALHYLSQVAAALDYAHQKNVIHKDIKPANIFVDTSNNVFILDFGIAAIMESYESGTASAGPALGTPGYMSPEQILSERLDSRTDLFSLAIVAFECLTGERPFVGKTFTEVIGGILNAKPQSLTAICPELPLALEAEFERALSKKKNSRFGTAQEMIEAFARSVGMLDRGAKGFLNAGSSASGWEIPHSRVSAAAQPSEGRLMPGAAGSRALNSVEAAVASGAAGPVGAGFVKQRTSALQVVTFVAGAIAVAAALRLFYIVYSPPQQTTPQQTLESMVEAGESSSSLLPLSDVDDSSVVAPLIVPKVEEAPAGVSISALNDKQLLGILINPKSPEGSIIEALREAASRKVPNLVDACVQPMQNDSYVVRIEAIKTVAQSGDRRIVPRVLAALDDHDPLVRGHAARALGILGDKNARRPLLERMVSEEVPEVKQAMRSAAERINGASGDATP